MKTITKRKSIREILGMTGMYIVYYGVVVLLTINAYDFIFKKYGDFFCILMLVVTLSFATYLLLNKTVTISGIKKERE